MPYSNLAFALNRGDPTPLYQQLRRSIRDAIEQKRLIADQALPAERDIAIDLGVSRITVRKAVDGLVEDGLLHRRHGVGTFVSSRVPVTKLGSAKSNSSKTSGNRSRITGR